MSKNDPIIENSYRSPEGQNEQKTGQSENQTDLQPMRIMQRTKLDKTAYMPGKSRKTKIL